jgi:hypothetical protein
MPSLDDFDQHFALSYNIFLRGINRGEYLKSYGLGGLCSEDCFLN